MVYEEVNAQQVAAKESNGALSQKGIISETMRRSHGSLPWRNRNSLNHFFHQQQALIAVGTSMTTVLMICDSEYQDDYISNRTGISEVQLDTLSKSMDKPCKNTGNAHATTKEYC
jgi:hypothetical protein